MIGLIVWCLSYLSCPIYICVFQVTVREADQGWIFGDYVCHARNRYGIGNQIITLRRASEHY